MRYAIGEIVLVVIGILIALQVNNFNEQHKLNKLKNVQLINLESDLKTDVIHLETEIISIKEAAKELGELRQRLISPNATKDTLYKIVNKEYDGKVRRFDNKFNNTTYTSLIQSGNIGLFSDELIKDLSNLNSVQIGTISSTNDHWTIYLEIVQNYTTLFAPKNDKNIIDDGPIADYLRKNTDFKDLIVGFNKVYMAKRLLYLQSISHLESTLETTKRFLETHFNTN